MSLRHGDVVTIEVKKAGAGCYSVTFSCNQQASMNCMLNYPGPVYLMGAIRKTNNSLEILSAKEMN